VAQEISPKKGERIIFMITKLYLSGDGVHVEHFIRDHFEDFREVGLLLSYWTLKAGKGRPTKRLNDFLEKEGNREDES
jgi:hypothetical protein